MNKSLLPFGYDPKTVQARQDLLKQQTGVKLPSQTFHDPEDMKGIIENHVGEVTIPMGICSPLKVNGDYAKGSFFVPVCTVEGTLAASMTRGMLATSREEGIQTTHIKQGVSRAPVFRFNSVKPIKAFKTWIDKNFEKIKTEAESSTRFGRLTKIDFYIIQANVILDFIYTTGNAAGQNMVSLATYKACEYIKMNYQEKLNYILDSNFASDKKASGINSIRGRGHYVVAETTLSRRTLKRFLKADVEDYIFEQQLVPYVAQFCNMQGIQLHIANALTAIYLATGQDTACVAENAIGYTQMIPLKEGAKFVLTMPSLTVGTVGGGTRLEQQRRNLEILGCHKGENSSKKLAEIICASTLCLEISLWSAIISDTWVSAHMKYGRN